jgi:hypothetical protein
MPGILRLLVRMFGESRGAYGHNRATMVSWKARLSWLANKDFVLQTVTTREGSPYERRAAGGEVAKCRVHGGVGASGQHNQAIGTFEWCLPGRYWSLLSTYPLQLHVRAPVLTQHRPTILWWFKLWLTREQVLIGVPASCANPPDYCTIWTPTPVFVIFMHNPT